MEREKLKQIIPIVITSMPLLLSIVYFFSMRSGYNLSKSGAYAQQIQTVMDNYAPGMRVSPNARFSTGSGQDQNYTTVTLTPPWGHFLPSHLSKATPGFETKEYIASNFPILIADLVKLLEENDLTIEEKNLITKTLISQLVLVSEQGHEAIHSQQYAQGGLLRQNSNARKVMEVILETLVPHKNLCFQAQYLFSNRFQKNAETQATKAEIIEYLRYHPESHLDTTDLQVLSSSIFYAAFAGELEFIGTNQFTQQVYSIQQEANAKMQPELSHNFDPINVRLPFLEALQLVVVCEILNGSPVGKKYYILLVQAIEELGIAEQYDQGNSTPEQIANLLVQNVIEYGVIQKSSAGDYEIRIELIQPRYGLGLANVD